VRIGLSALRDQIRVKSQFQEACATRPAQVGLTGQAPNSMTLEPITSTILDRPRRTMLRMPDKYHIPASI
jgi:hypothetical protein